MAGKHTVAQVFVPKNFRYSGQGALGEHEVGQPVEVQIVDDALHDVERFGGAGGKNGLTCAELSTAQIGIPAGGIGIEKRQHQVQQPVLIEVECKHAGALLHAHFEQMRGKIAVSVIFEPKKQGVLVNRRCTIGSKKVHVTVVVEIAAGYFAAVQHQRVGNGLRRTERVVAEVFAPADTISHRQRQVFQAVAVEVGAKALAAQAFEPAFFEVFPTAQIFDKPGVVDQNIVVAVALHVC